ncbi:MAG: epimerase, partial [Acidimicrobiia bacterium]|nr:epimerase [Acidimicrobiia bacterium]
MRIAVTGSSGLIGTALLARLVGDGHETVRLLRTVVGGDAVGGDGVAQWDPEVGTIDASALEG